jgi:2-keto-4-pentenoate hydratase/2-oxohepta-3-ene-1,7-dioic acid hydratase in catechol pathway
VKFATFDRGGKPALGIIEGDAILDLQAAGGSAPASMMELIAGGARTLDQVREAARGAGARKGDGSVWKPLASTRLLAPIPRPTKNVFCVGRNYKLHIEEGARAHGREPTFPKVPEFFSKPPTAVIGHDADIRWDSKATQKLDYEVELAIVIGRTCRDLPKGKTMDAVFGYTIVNDVSARDLQTAHGQWFKGKGLDTFCPVGPYIVTADEFGNPSGHRIGLRVNGETRQDSNTSDLLFDCDAILEALSASLTLEPGDVVATGTPSGVALGMTPQKWLLDGDVVEAEVEGIGVLRNTVREVKR